MNAFNYCSLAYSCQLKSHLVTQAPASSDHFRHTKNLYGESLILRIARRKSIDLASKIYLEADRITQLHTD